MKRPIIPRPRRARPFGAKFGRDSESFGGGRKPEPPPKTYLPQILICLGMALFLCLLICLLGQVPKVKEVRVTGGDIYSAEVMLQYVDVHTGDKLMAFDSGDIEAQMMEAMPLLADARVQKHISGNVTVTATEHRNLYYTCHNRNYYIFTSDSLRVLCALPDDSEARRVGAVYIGLPESARVRVGECVGFVNLPYAPETQSALFDYEVETDVPEKENAYVEACIDALMSSSLAPRIKGLELSDRYDIWFVLDGQVRIRIGDVTELEDKLSTAIRALEERAASGVDAGELPLLLDVSDPTRIIFRASPDVTIPAWG